MIKRENGEIEMQGLYLELLHDFSTITNALYRSLLEELDGELAKKLINFACKYGLAEADKHDLEE